MRNISLWLECISCKIVCIMAAVLLLLLTCWSGVYTHMLVADLSEEKVRLYQDNPWINICWFLISALFFRIISKVVLTKNEEKNKKIIHILAVVATVFVGIIGVIWVTISTCTPYHDQLQVVEDAMAFLKGDYSDLKGYLEIYPHQLGLVFFYEMLFAVWPAYRAVYYFHVIWLMIIVYFTYAVSEELFADNNCSLCSIAAAAAFVPMYFYVNYAYGDLSCAACGVLGIWLLTKFCKSRQIRYAVFLILTMTVGSLARKNIYVVIIAMVIVLMIYGMKQKNYYSFLVAALLVVFPLGMLNGIKMYYEMQADAKMVAGQPAILHIAMGMQESWEGPGYYNAYNLKTYVDADKDAVAASKIAKEYISDRFREMRQDLSYTRNFYQVKIWQQWNDPSFSGELSTNRFESTPRNFVLDIYFGALQEFLRAFRNRYLFVLYIGAFLGTIRLLFTPKDKDNIWKHTICIILIGGFLFSLIWENKSRYVMPYIVMLLPYGAYGLSQLQSGGMKLMKLLYKSFEK